jgi:hypothetical protein
MHRGKRSAGLGILLDCIHKLKASFGKAQREASGTSKEIDRWEPVH